MDTGEGRFVKAERLEELQQQYTNHGGIFKVGEEIELRGSKFRIQRITLKKLTLRLLRRG